jgi:guanine deaminase
MMHAYRSALLRFNQQGQVLYDEDGLLVIGPDATGRQVVQLAGDYRALEAGFASAYPGLTVTPLPGRILAPGFIDLHIHYPQTDVIGSPADGLLPWLENYTFPHESRFGDRAYAGEVAHFFLDELQRHGVTSALTFATSHPQSVDALMTEARVRGLRLIAGKVLQDRHSPDGVRDETEQSLIDTDTLIRKWHGVDRLGYAITPRFAPSCSPANSPRSTRTCGFNRMWRRTATKSLGRASSFQLRAATSRSTKTLGCCASVPSTPTASISTTLTVP